MQANKSIGKMITNRLTEKGEVWPLFVGIRAYTVDIFASPSLSGSSPCELHFVHMRPDLFNLAFPLSEQFGNTYKDYLQLMKEKSDLIGAILLDNKAMQAQDRVQNASMYQKFSEGHLVYLLVLHTSFLWMRTKKFFKII